MATRVDLLETAAQAFNAVGRGLARLGRFVRRKPLGGIGLFLLLIVIIMAIFSRQIAPHDPKEQFFRSSPTAEQPLGELLRLNGPFTSAVVPDRSTADPLDSKSVFFLLGTDNLSRDLFSRLVYGARNAVVLSLMSVLIGTTIGTFVGLISGYVGGMLDLVVQRIVDGWMAIPALVLAITIVHSLGPSTWSIIIGISAFIWPAVSRIIRSVTLGVREHQYVDAARALGASDARILFRHVLPQTMAPIIIVVSTLIGAAIVIEAALSFLGVGLTEPSRGSWGLMLSGDQVQFIRVQPLVVLWPGIFISLTVFGANLLGDSMRDVWDPRLRGV